MLVSPVEPSIINRSLVPKKGSSEITKSSLAELLSIPIVKVCPPLIRKLTYGSPALLPPTAASKPALELTLVLSELVTSQVTSPPELERVARRSPAVFWISPTSTTKSPVPFGEAVMEMLASDPSASISDPEMVRPEAWSLVLKVPEVLVPPAIVKVAAKLELSGKAIEVRVRVPAPVPPIAGSFVD